MKSRVWAMKVEDWFGKGQTDEGKGGVGVGGVGVVEVVGVVSRMWEVEGEGGVRDMG